MAKSRTLRPGQGKKRRKTPTKNYHPGGKYF